MLKKIGYVCSQNKIFYRIIMNNISTLFHLLQHSWLAVFLVSWVNSLLGMDVQGSRSKRITPEMALDVVSAYAVLLSIPMNKHRGAYTLPHAVWLG